MTAHRGRRPSLEARLARLRRQRALGHISHEDYQIRRALLVEAWGPLPLLDKGGNGVAATVDPTRNALAELGRRRAWGQVTQREYELQRASLLEAHSVTESADSANGALPADHVPAPPPTEPPLSSGTPVRKTAAKSTGGRERGKARPLNLLEKGGNGLAPAVDPAQDALAELGRRRAWGQVTQQEYELQRASLLEAHSLTESAHPANGASPPADHVPAVPEVVSRPEVGRSERLTTLTSAALVVGAAACIATTLPGPWVVVGAVAIALSIAWRGSVQPRELITTLFGITVVVTAVDYLAWRAVVANWAGWEIAAPLLVAEIFGALHVLGLQYTIWPRHRPEHVSARDATSRPIFILIPTVNEGRSVLTPTIKAAIEARRRFLRAFPKERVTIAVCNDGRVAGVDQWRDAEELARQLRVTCITRAVGGGNKAGNLEHARQQLCATGDALVAIFDADQIAKPDFLVKTIPHFADPGVGWVQTGQYYGNLENPVARWANDQQALFYRVLCPGKAAQNSAFICGTNVVIRATALDQIGGLPQDSVTEDFAASIQLHPRWRSIFLTEVLAVGLGPMDLPAYLRQQRRWAIGTMSVLLRHWRAIFLPQRGGLRMEQRIQYGLACTHYLGGLRDLIYIVSPLAFLATGIPAVRSATLVLFLWHFLPYWLASQLAFWYAGRGVTGLRGVIMGFGSFPVLLQALVTVLLRRRASFMVTSKQRRRGRAWKHLTVYALAIVCCCATIAVALGTKRLRTDSLAISVMWVTYDVALLGTFLWVGILDLRFREAAVGVRVATVRHATHPRGLALVAWARAAFSAAYNTSGRRRAFAAGVVTIAVALAISVPLTISLAATPAPVVIAADRHPGQSVYLGLSLPYQLLETRPATLETEVCLPLTVIGRTQDISDSFDLAWANQLSVRGQRPWITLQFGNFAANGSAPLSASLPAIENGVQDANIQRWANEIHAYGKPVLLTVLLQVDRNWAVSSAVANGGIPEDVPRAWEHVQSIFKAAGDTNVAWVWGPADPAHDQAYAPPAATIDIVLQDMIRYPGTAWPDPATVLSAVSERHPGKPVLLEVSAAGPPAEKAAWLEEVAKVVEVDPQVYALLYHEGSPDLHATAAENAQWSVESDASSLQAARTWQSLVPTSTLPCRPSLTTSARNG
jgi:cellulose synthase/poly-beta-1,6-N-acetylglucosamine synthase-like glycosyltransferase